MVFNHWCHHITQVKTTTAKTTMQWSIVSGVDSNAFLLESESRNLSLLYHLGGDSTLVPQILNVRNSTVARTQQTYFAILLMFTFIHFDKPPHHKGKKPILLFFLVKNFIYDLWLVRCSFITCEKNQLTYQNLCSSLQINFFSNLAWSKSQYIYYKPAYIHTHLKNFGLSKTLLFSKHTTKIRSPWLTVWDTTTICA